MQLYNINNNFISLLTGYSFALITLHNFTKITFLKVVIILLKSEIAFIHYPASQPASHQTCITLLLFLWYYSVISKLECSHSQVGCWFEVRFMNPASRDPDPGIGPRHLNPSTKYTQAMPIQKHYLNGSKRRPCLLVLSS